MLDPVSPQIDNKVALFCLTKSFNKAVNGGEQSGCLSLAKKVLNVAFPIIVALNLLLLPFIMAYNCFFSSSGIEQPVVSQAGVENKSPADDDGFVEDAAETPPRDVDGEDTNIADDVVVEEPAGTPPQNANVGDTNIADDDGFVEDAAETPPRDVDGEDTNIADDVVVEEPAGIPPQDANVGEAAAGTGEDTNPTDVADAIRTPPRATVADTGDQIVTRFWGQRPIPAPSTPAARPETARPSVTGSFSADRWIDGTWVPTTNKKPPVSPQPPAPATPSFLDSMMSFGSSALALINTTRNP